MNDDYEGRIRKQNGCMMFLGEYGALMKKMLLLTKRKRGQTIAEFILAYVFFALLLIMRSLLDRTYRPELQIPTFHPHQNLLINSTRANVTYFYPNNTCTQSIMSLAMTKLQANVPGFSNTLAPIPDPTISSLPSTTLESIFAYVVFTNVPSACASSGSIPDQVQYTLRMQENGLYYYRPQQVKLKESDVYWKRSLENYCQDNTTWLNYTTQFLGVQYFVDLSIIEYVTGTAQSATAVSMRHFGCPEFYLDVLHSGFSFFVPLFYSVVYLITVVLNIGYIVEERANKTKEYLRIFGLRTWVNNLVWLTRSMCIYIILTSVCTLFSSISLSSSTPKAVFNSTHWTVIWTVLFVYSIQVSAFVVFYGQLFKNVLLAKLIVIVIWIITFIDFYATAPLALRYILCFLPNAGLLFCLQVMQQFERRSRGMMTFQHLYYNIFDYPLYVGLCLLLMLVYAVIYLLLAVYVERINPGEFGIAQPWYFLFTKAYWKPTSTNAAVEPSDKDKSLSTVDNSWVEMKPTDDKLVPVMKINQLNKKFGKFSAVTDLSLEFYSGEVCALLGHNGAGKTTTTFMLVGMLKPTSGSITIDGLDNQIHIEKVRHNLGFCPQYDILYDELSVEEHLELIAKMRRMDKNTMKASNERILQLISLTNDRNTLAKDLSGGMKRRLSIGISLINDPKMIILDEPTSGIDPYNRRLIWTIVQQLKGSGRSVLLTTHFLDEADVLSDRIAIMSRGQLQANGTPNFLKKQIDFEYRLAMDRDQDRCSTDQVTRFIQQIVPQIELERESVGELIYGIRRNQSKEVERLITQLDQDKDKIGVKSYGLSMTSIEDVFLRLVEEEEKRDLKNSGKPLTGLDDQVFRKEYNRLTGGNLFWMRLWALLIKRWHLSRRQLTLLFGFLLLPLLVEILNVSVVPTPQELQSILLSNERINDSSIKFTPSNYNPHTIVSYSNENTSPVRSNLINYISGTGATLDEIYQNNVMNYVRDRYLQSAQIFYNRYQMSFASYYTLANLSLYYDAYFSTVNYHTIPTSLNVATNNLFRFHASSTAKSIETTNQPIITSPRSASVIAQILAVIYCFDVFPVSLFAFLNSILVTIFIGVLLLTLISERLCHSKDLQLLSNTSRFTYWLSNWLFDMLLCVCLCALLTIVVKIGAEANPKSEAEVRIYRNTEATGYFFLLIFLYTIASLPFAYSFSFIPRTSIIGFTNFFIINVIGNIVDSVINSFTVFSRDSSDTSRPTRAYSAVSFIRWILAVLLPSVNFKQALSNSQLHENRQCISIFNAIVGTSFSQDERWGSSNKPGVGAQILIFCLQCIFWTVILILIENKLRVRKFFRKICCCCCCCCNSNCSCCGRRSNSVALEKSVHWSEADLDEDVRHERQLILANDPSVNQSVILVRDLIKRFEKAKKKTKKEGGYVAVDHLNFHVQGRECFGLLGANGAGKTTTFRMLVRDTEPTEGDILINGRSIVGKAKNDQKDVEIGFCPQFDWLMDDLTVSESLMLFARLKGIRSAELTSTCENMMALFGLEMYADRCVQRLSGGNKRKTSAAIAFMANPSLVFLDEPTTGLDAAAKRKLWKVIRSARDLGLTIIMTSHSMEECEALCTKLGIMKMGQFTCFGTLQHLRNRFSTGYAVQIKVGAHQDLNRVKEQLARELAGLEIQSEQNEMLFCNIPFSRAGQSSNSMSLGRIFQVLNRKKEERLIETYSLTQTTLEQIFVQLAGEDEESKNDRNRKGGPVASSTTASELPPLRPTGSPPAVLSNW